MSLAQQIFDKAFAPGRAPRSDAYKEGVRDTLRYRAGEIETLKGCNPYAEGTAENDAWGAGNREGHARWRDYEAGIE